MSVLEEQSIRAAGASNDLHEKSNHQELHTELFRSLDVRIVADHLNDRPAVGSIRARSAHLEVQVMSFHRQAQGLQYLSDADGEDDRSDETDRDADDLET